MVLEGVADKVGRVRRLGPLALIGFRSADDAIEQPSLLTRDSAGAREIHRQRVVTPTKHVVVHEEELDARLGEKLLQADAEPRWRSAAHLDGLAPVATGSVGALREPETARAPADVSFEGGEPLLDLGMKARVLAQEWQIAMRRGRADDLDVSGLVEVPIAAKKVAPEFLDEVPK